MVPHRKDEIYRELDKYIHTVDSVSKEKCSEIGTVGWCYILTRALLGKGYRICICEALEGEDLYDFVLMHEIGHIIFGHSELKTALDQELAEEKIKAVFSNLEKYFKSYSLPEIYQYFRSYLFNMIRDFEVNSRLFTKEEFGFMEKGLSDYRGEKTELCWPERYGFPVGLTDNEYLLLVLENPEKFFRNSIADSGDSGDGSGWLKPQDLKDFEKKVNDFIDKIKKEYEKQGSITREQLEKQAEENDVNLRFTGDEDAEKITTQIADWSDYKDLERKIYSLLQKKEQVLEKRDQLWNYNRGRYGTDVLVPKTRKIQKTRTPYLTVLLDISGSIAEMDVLGFCEVFKSLCRKLSRKSRIVLWNTELARVFEDTDEIEPESGGGTDIGPGIGWCWENRKPDDLLFAVSDCEDNLESWLDRYKKKKYLVCWRDLDTIKERTSDKYLAFRKEWENILIKK